jgi:hypothetical protein
MKSKTFSNKWQPLERALLVFCIMAGLMTALASAAQENTQDKNVCTGAEMGDYAKLVFCLPPEVVVEAESMTEENYTDGREVAASMLLDGNRVGLHLLYPCEAPQKELQPVELKPYLENYNPIMSQAKYNESVPGPVLWGQIGNQIFVSYQPNNQTIALILMDMNMSESMMTAFLGNLSIAVNDSIAPPSNCPDTTKTASENTVTTQTAVQNNTETNTATNNQVTSEKSTGNTVTPVKKNAASDINAARARLEAMKKNR